MGNLPVQYIIRQITPVDNAVCAVRYDLQSSFAGPVELSTGPYIYREAKTSMISLALLYKGTDVTQTLTVNGTLNSNISSNFQSVNMGEILSFYNRAYQYAENYFANVTFNNTLIKGYTGSSIFSGSGITGSYNITTQLVASNNLYNPAYYQYYEDSEVVVLSDPNNDFYNWGENGWYDEGYYWAY